MKQPNILFFLSDQHRAQALGCYGDDKARTPRLDSLAAEGALFKNAYCQNPLCVPSRSSLLTGRYSRNIGIYQNRHILEHNTVTLPRVFAQAGYRTCVVGKTHFNGEQFHGYQERPYGDLYGQAHQPDPERRPEFGEAGLGGMVANAGVSEIPLAMTQTEICVAESVKWLQVHRSLHREQPFFLSVNFDKPHFPMKCPGRIFERFEGKIGVPKIDPAKELDSVPFVREAIRRTRCDDDALARRALAGYYGCIEWVDDAVGRILDALRFLGYGQSTLVIYASDHGEMGGDHHIWNKSVFFDASVRVPLFVRWPERVRAGAVIPDQVGLIDIFPTLCEAANIHTPASCDGLSLLTILGEGKSVGRDFLHAESALLEKPEMAGCMTLHGPWKYNYYIDGSEELYDLKIDANEMNNLVKNKEYESVSKSLKAETIRFWDPERQLERFAATPAMKQDKHAYPYSNQFVTASGIADARP